MALPAPAPAPAPAPELIEFSRIVAREAISRVSPEKIELFDEALNKADDSQDQRRSRTEPTEIGSGLEALAGSFVFIIYPLVIKLVEHLIDAGLEVIKDKAKSWLSAKLGKPQNPGHQSPPLTEEQVKTIKAEIRSFSLTRGLADEEVEALESALLSKLAAS